MFKVNWPDSISVQRRIDETEKVFVVGADEGDDIERFLSLRLVEALLDELRIAENGPRGPQLVAHVGHEVVLVLAGDLKIFEGVARPRSGRKVRVWNIPSSPIGQQARPSTRCKEASASRGAQLGSTLGRQRGL